MANIQQGLYLHNGGWTCGYSALFTLSLLLRVAYFEQYTTKPSANHLSSPMKVFCCVYDGNPDVFPLENFDHAVCDVRHLELRYRRPSCSRSYRGKFGKSTLNYYSNSDASFHLNYFKVCGDVHPNPGPTTANNNPKQSTDSTKSRKAPVWKCPCALCLKPVRANQKGILCDICIRWHHIKCLNMDPKLYMALSSSDEEWYCNDLMTVRIRLILRTLSLKPRVALMTLMFLPTKKAGSPRRTVVTRLLSAWCLMQEVCATKSLICKLCF